MKTALKAVSSKFVVALVCSAIVGTLFQFAPIHSAIGRLLPPPSCPCPFHKPHPVEMTK